MYLKKKKNYKKERTLGRTSAGGPGMIFSHELLRRMLPHMGECLREMYTTHEYVGVGRCVRCFSGTVCLVL